MKHKIGRPATQDWVHNLTIMQQSVLLSAIRGCDGIAKRHKHKPLVKWYRRCVLLSAFDGIALSNPFYPGGGSFTGPIKGVDGEDLSGPLFEALPPNKQHDMRCDALQHACDDFIDSRDELPFHYFTHFMHASEILGYKHPDKSHREFWNDFYIRMVHTLHLWPETLSQMDMRLGDNISGWGSRNDVSSSCSD